jgi:hypothetical protein
MLKELFPQTHLCGTAQSVAFKQPYKVMGWAVPCKYVCGKSNWHPSHSFVMRHEILPVELSFNMAISGNPKCPTYGLPFLLMLQCSCWSRKFCLASPGGSKVWSFVSVHWHLFMMDHLLMDEPYLKAYPIKMTIHQWLFSKSRRNVPWWSTHVASEIRNPYLMLLIGRLHHYLAQGEGLFDCFQCIFSIKN